MIIRFKQYYINLRVKITRVIRHPYHYYILKLTRKNGVATTHRKEQAQVYHYKIATLASFNMKITKNKFFE